MTRVVIADDDALVRGGIAMLLSAAPDLVVVGEASDGAQAIALARSQHADLVIMDLRMPGTDGVAATRELTAETGDPDELIKVLVLTTFNDDPSVFGALRAGASGFLIKDSAPGQLVEAARTVADGGGWIDPAVVGQVVKVLRAAPESQGQCGGDLVGRLTPREREVLILMAHGLSNAEIGARLFLSDATVRTHVSRILMKTGSRDRTQAVVLAYRTHLVAPST